MTRARRASAVLLGALLGVLLVAGCSGGSGGSDEGPGDADPPVLGRQLVEQQVRTQLGDEVGREPEEVACPGDLVGEVDQQIRCTLTDSGTELGVTVTVTRVRGQDADLDIVVDPS